MWKGGVVCWERAWPVGVGVACGKGGVVRRCGRGQRIGAWPVGKGGVVCGDWAWLTDRGVARGGVGVARGEWAWPVGVGVA